MMNNLFVRLNYPVDKAVILAYARCAREFAKPYTDARYHGMQMDNWHKGHYTDEHIEKLMLDFNIDGKPRFYWTEPN